MSGKERMIILLNIGRITNPQDGDVPDAASFMSKAKTCLMRLLERNIFTKPKDEVAIFLMGTEESKNDLAETHGGYDHISLLMPFCIPSWGLLRVLRHDIQNTQHSSDWLDALIVAIDYLKNGAGTTDTKTKITSQKVVLITPFLEAVNPDKADSVIDQINEMRIDFIVISDELEYKPTAADEREPLKLVFTQTELKTATQQQSERLIERIVTETNGVLSNFSDAVLQLAYFPGTKSHSMPWYCPLTIMDDLRIHVAAYLYVTREAMKSFKTIASGDAHAKPVVCSYQYQMMGQVVQDLDLSTTIEGYALRDRKVPFDKQLNLDYDAGEKSFRCIGFTHRKYVLDENFGGSSTYLVVPQATCDKSVQLLNVLGTVLLKMDSVIVARRVRQKNEKPKLMALFPMRHPQYQTVYFHMIELVFSENMLDPMEFAPLAKRVKSFSEEQLQAVRDLITAADLTADGVEVLDMERTLNPNKQFMYRVIAARAMDPNLPLPEFSEDLRKLFEMPEAVKERSQEACERIKALYPIKEKEATKKTLWMKRKATERTANEEDSSATPTQEPDEVSQFKGISKIGSIRPMEDFDVLYRSGVRFGILCGQLQQVLADLIFNSMSWEYETEKIGKAMLFYREEAKIAGAHYYNDWIVKFKLELFIRDIPEFFHEVIVKEHLGLIGADESDSSQKTAKDVAEFYTSNVLATKVRDEPEAGGNEEDIFDDM